MVSMNRKAVKFQILLIPKPKDNEKAGYENIVIITSDLDTPRKPVQHVRTHAF